MNIELLKKQLKELKYQLEFESNSIKIRELEEDIYEVEDTISKLEKANILQQLRSY